MWGKYLVYCARYTKIDLRTIEFLPSFNTTFSWATSRRDTTCRLQEPRQYGRNTDGGRTASLIRLIHLDASLPCG
jgi:hypothetical protein